MIYSGVLKNNQGFFTRQSLQSLKAILHFGKTINGVEDALNFAKRNIQIKKSLEMAFAFGNIDDDARIRH